MKEKLTRKTVIFGLFVIPPLSAYPTSSGFSKPHAKPRRRRNHCEQPFAFPSSMRVHVSPTSKTQMTSLSLFFFARNIRDF